MILVFLFILINAVSACQTTYNNIDCPIRGLSKRCSCDDGEGSSFVSCFFALPPESPNNRKWSVAGECGAGEVCTTIISEGGFFSVRCAPVTTTKTPIPQSTSPQSTPTIIEPVPQPSVIIIGPLPQPVSLPHRSISSSLSIYTMSYTGISLMLVLFILIFRQAGDL